MNKSFLFLIIFLLIGLLGTSCITVNNPAPPQTSLAAISPTSNSNLSATNSPQQSSTANLQTTVAGSVYLLYQANIPNVPASQQTTLLNENVSAILSRVFSLGVAEPTITLLGENKIKVVLVGIKDIDKVKQAISNAPLLEFGVQATNANDTAIKWSENPYKNVVGYWKLATGVVNGQTLALTSYYFKQNTRVGVDNMNKIELYFEWDSTGSELSKQITGQLVNGNKPLGIFRADGTLVSAPSVQAQITDSGRITGLTQDEASTLSNLLNARRLSVPLVLIEESAMP